MTRLEIGLHSWGGKGYEKTAGADDHGTNSYYPRAAIVALKSGMTITYEMK